MKNEIDFWCKDGISHDEIKRRLAERSDEECLRAVNWSLNLGLITRQLGVKIAQAADELRDAGKVLNQVEPKLKEYMTGKIPDGQNLDVMLELHALVVEAYVRQAKKTFPEVSLN